MQANYNSKVRVENSFVPEVVSILLCHLAKVWRVTDAVSGNVKMRWHSVVRKTIFNHNGKSGERCVDDFGCQ